MNTGTVIGSILLLRWLYLYCRVVLDHRPMKAAAARPRIMPSGPKSGPS